MRGDSNVRFSPPDLPVDFSKYLLTGFFNVFVRWTDMIRVVIGPIVQIRFTHASTAPPNRRAGRIV